MKQKFLRNFILFFLAMIIMCGSAGCAGEDDRDDDKYGEKTTVETKKYELKEIEYIECLE